jgi:hypothetical protein
MDAMTDASAGPWPIRLRRSLVRLFLTLGLRAAIGVAAVLTAFATFGTVALVLNVAGLICLAYALLLGIYVLSLRLEATPGELRLHSLLGTRRYRLANGQVTRLWVQFSRRAPLEARIAGLGIRVGEGQLGQEKLVDVISLDRSATLLMVPVVGGRLAVAVESESELLKALGAATSFVPIRE